MALNQNQLISSRRFLRPILTAIFGWSYLRLLSWTLKLTLRMLKSETEEKSIWFKAKESQLVQEAEARFNQLRFYTI
jgi:hypothetical protein